MSEITGQHGEIGHQVMTEQDGLGPLQMGIARHDDVAVLLRRFDDGFLQLDHQLRNRGDFPARVHMRIQRHLVVAAPARMKPFSRFADGVGQALFDIHMNIFQLDGKFKFTLFNLLVDGFQPGYDRILICRRNNALPFQHRRVGNAAANIFRIHAAVKLDGGVKLFYAFIRGLRKPAAP